MFETLIGQDKVKKYFTGVIAGDRVPHSLLLTGPPGTGKTAAAIELARILTCQSDAEKPCGECASCRKFTGFNHPDVHMFFPLPPELKDIAKKTQEIQAEREKIALNPYANIDFEKNATIPISLVKTELKNRLKFKSYQDHGRVVIILSIEKMTIEAANALLKLLEEPPDDVTFILTTAVIDNVLPTIKSRCQTVHTVSIPAGFIAENLEKNEGMSTKEAQVYASLSGGNYSRALDFLSDDFQQRKELCMRIVESCTGDPLENTIELAEELAASSRSDISDVSVRSVLELFLSILRISYEGLLSGDTSTVESAGSIDLPVKKLADYRMNLLESAISEVEKSVDLVNKNVYLYLILLILFLRLRKIFKHE